MQMHKEHREWRDGQLELVFHLNYNYFLADSFKVALSGRECFHTQRVSVKKQ